MLGMDQPHLIPTTPTMRVVARLTDSNVDTENKLSAGKMLLGRFIGLNEHSPAVGAALQGYSAPAGGLSGKRVGARVADVSQLELLEGLRCAVGLPRVDRRRRALSAGSLVQRSQFLGEPVSKRLDSQPRQGPSTPIGAYLSECLVSVVRKSRFVFSYSL